MNSPNYDGLRVNMNHHKLVIGFSVCILLATIPSCSSASEPGSASTIAANAIEREAVIPPNSVKMYPETDENPPLLHSRD